MPTMTASSFDVAGPLWAITSYYNPSRYWRRRYNYRLFREHLQIPLLAVELSFQGDFELASDDAEILVRCTGGDVLWQKERLLNIALERLPRSCQQVVWVDCDVVFQRPDWALALREQLDSTPLVQPFSQVLHLRRDALPNSEPEASSDIACVMPSVAGLIDRGAAAADCLGKDGEFRQRKRAPGLVWAARRDLLARHGLYDACITGGGDTALAAAAYGIPEAVVRFQAMNTRQASHYRAWAEAFYHSIRGRVGWLEGELWHLWHGERGERRVPQRYHDLTPFDFDPAADIHHDSGGCWRWNSNKPQLHACLESYFAARNEDGEALCEPALQQKAA
jgi:hypothetical protein